MVEEAGGGGLLTVEGGLVIWTLVVFGLLLFILKRSAWPVLLQAVREREQRLERQLAEAAQAREEAARLLEQQKQALERARAEAQEIVTKAKVVAEKERAALLARAREEYELLLARAKKDIEEEKAKAILALRREAVDLSIAAASRLIAQNLDSEANRRLALEYLASLAARPAGADRGDRPGVSGAPRPGAEPRARGRRPRGGAGRRARAPDRRAAGVGAGQGGPSPLPRRSGDLGRGDRARGRPRVRRVAQAQAHCAATQDADGRLTRRGRSETARGNPGRSRFQAGTAVLRNPSGATWRAARTRAAARPP